MPLAQVVAHIDHICQILGSAAHVGLGTDMDGGFGAEDIADPIDSSADLPLLAHSLRAYGYGETDVRGIMGAKLARPHAACLARLTRTRHPAPQKIESKYSGSD